MDPDSLLPWQRPPICEYTAPGSTTVSIDCLLYATKRHVRDGVTVAVFCDTHSDPATSATVETIEVPAEGI